MKPLEVIALTSLVFLMVGCDGDLNIDQDIKSASILSVSTTECYCCPGLSIAINGDIYFVDSIPDSSALNTAIEKEVFPIDVLLKTSSYMGDCPNRELDVTHIELSE